MIIRGREREGRPQVDGLKLKLSWSGAEVASQLGKEWRSGVVKCPGGGSGFGLVCWRSN